MDEQQIQFGTICANPVIVFLSIENHDFEESCGFLFFNDMEILSGNQIVFDAILAALAVSGQSQGITKKLIADCGRLFGSSGRSLGVKHLEMIKGV